MGERSCSIFSYVAGRKSSRKFKPSPVNKGKEGKRKKGETLGSILLKKTPYAGRLIQDRPDKKTNLLNRTVEGEKKPAGARGRRILDNGPQTGGGGERRDKGEEQRGF